MQELIIKASQVILESQVLRRDGRGLRIRATALAGTICHEASIGRQSASGAAAETNTNGG